MLLTCEGAQGSRIRPRIVLPKRKMHQKQLLSRRRAGYGRGGSGKRPVIGAQGLDDDDEQPAAVPVSSNVLGSGTGKGRDQADGKDTGKATGTGTDTGGRRQQRKRSKGRGARGQWK